jgi:hypothetical protein
MEQKKELVDLMTEVYTVGLQEHLRHIKPKELATLNQKYKECSVQGTNTIKLLEQLLLSVSLVLIHDKHLQKASIDKWVSLSYSVREELSSLFALIEMHYQ